MKNRQNDTLFRKKALDHIASPEQLTDYLRVTDIGVWIILASVIFLLLGLLVWSAVGTIQTTAAAKVIVRDHGAELVVPGQEEALEAGMSFCVAGQEFLISGTDTDVYGRTIAYAEVLLPDGIYDAEVVLERIRPLSFLLEEK